MPRTPLPLTGQGVDLTFPFRGIDRADPFAGQRNLTTPDAVNVVGYEPTTDRMRGGSRPGLARYVAGRVPGGASVIQGLGVVVRSGYDGLIGLPDATDPDPVTGLTPIPDPSSAGPPTSWGTGILYPDPVTGSPVRGTDIRTRVPPRTIRYGGSGRQPTKNGTRTPPPESDPAVTDRCFTGALGIQIVDVTPDPFHWNGQKPAFFGKGCFPYFPGGGLNGPASAMAFPSITSQVNDFMENHVGNGFGPSGGFIVIADSVSGPGAVCTFGSDCA